MKSIKLILPALALLLASCERDTELEPPAFVKQPVLISYISPSDPVIKAELSYTVPYFGKYRDTAERIYDAAVSITDEGTGATATLQHQANGVYQVNASALPVEPGHRYTMRVELPGGFTCSSSTTVPPQPKLEDLKITSWSMGDKRESNWGYVYWPFSLQLNYSGEFAENEYAYAEFMALLEDGPFGLYEESIWFNNSGLAGDAGAPYKFFGESEFGDYGTADPSFQFLAGTFWLVDENYKAFYETQYQNEGNPFQEPILFHSSMSTGALGFLGSYTLIQGEIYP
jgi:hypothetical protein